MKSKTKTSVFWAIVLLVVALVLSLDLIEIITGNLMQLTNSMRPRIGRFWMEESKTQKGSTSISSLKSNAAIDSTLVYTVESFQELESLLRSHHTLTMKRADFLTLYRKIKPAYAKHLVSPMVLYDMSRNEKWKKARLTLQGNHLHLYFYDGFNQLLWDRDLNLSGLQTRSGQLSSRLTNSSLFQGRVVEADLFLKAFDNLSDQHRLQIVNDLYKLIEWEKTLAFVGISPVVQNGTVEIAFETFQNNASVIDTLQASEIAAAYLIQQINKLDPDITMRSPVEKEIEP